MTFMPALLDEALAVDHRPDIRENYFTCISKTVHTIEYQPSTPFRHASQDGQSFRNSLGARWAGSASSTSMSSSGGRSPSHQVGMEG